MEGESKQEHNEQVVCVPEYFKIGAADELKGSCDHEEQRYSDYVSCDASSCYEADSDGVLWIQLSNTSSWKLIRYE